MFSLRLRSFLLILPLGVFTLAWIDWRFVSRLHLGRTILVWLLSVALYTAFLGSIRYLCQGNPWRVRLQVRFVLNHLMGMVAAAVMMGLPMWLSGSLLQMLFPVNEGWLKVSSLIMATEVAVLVYVPAVFLTYLIDLSRRTQQLEREQLQAEAARAQSALEGLKSAIHPHFLFNVLNMLIPEIHRDPAKAVELVDDLSSFLVLSLKMTDKRMVSAKEEFHHARLYMDMERRRVGDRLTVEWQVHLDRAEELMIPPLIILPLLENSVKHGVACSSGPVWIELSCVLDGAWLDIRLANNVCDQDSRAKKAPGLGLGLNNLRQRLELFYEGGFALRSERLPDRYWTHLRLPVSHSGRHA
jgi:sensor histidine kinase YesM